VVAFKKVITDQYFRLITEPKEDEKPEAKALRHAATKQAHTLAWSVSYYLAQVKLDNLLAYFQELGNLPRDLPFDEDVQFLVFAKAFGLIDPRDPTKVDMGKFNSLAKDWDEYMHKTPLELQGVLAAIEDKKKEIKAAVVNPPNQGGGPGGFGPGGAGGGPGFGGKP